MTLHCESCDSPATRKDACGTALCGRCWSADEPTWLYRVRGADGKTRLITEAQKELLLDAVFAPIPPAPQSVIDAGVAVLDAAFAMACPNCGGSIIGDGYTVVLHCENAEDLDMKEPDADIVLCRPEPEVNYDAPRPPTPMESWQRNDEHNVK